MKTKNSNVTPLPMDVPYWHRARRGLIYTVAFLAFLISLTHSLHAQNDLDYKVMMGYQGWFNAAGDNSAPNEWRHWFRNQTNPSADQLNIDLWPEMTEYTTQYNTNMTYSNGQNAKLFSSHDASTVNVHFKWMRDYNIYGVYLQRFLGEAVNDPRFFQMRNNVLQNVINASATYDRHFAIMYDISGVPDDGNLYDKLVKDWEYLVNTYNVTNREGYVKQEGRPVIAIWGIGFNNRGLKPETFEALINYFHNTAAPQYRAYIVGGVPGQWRTLDGDSETDPRWRNIYHSLDMISPWAVGRYGNDAEADNWKNEKIVKDLTDCNTAGVDYMPVIFPGFSWYNMNITNPDRARYPLNQIPRRGGNFYWRQAYNAIGSGSKFVYVAMFDEVDEATAMFKVAPNKASTPSNTSIVTLDMDGTTLPSDWYLRLANETQKMLDKSIALTPTIPISPNNIAVTGISVAPTVASVAINGTTQLTATVAPSNATNKNVTWSSSNTAVATVSSTGLVTGKTAGTATITVTTQDGGKTATATITVTSTSGFQFVSKGNPVFRNIYTADPSAHVWADGRLYVYPSHDIEPPQGCDLMDQYHVYSTDDMVNWVDHGEILRASQVPFGRPEGGFMWAPDCAYRNGTYYFYFPHPSGAGDTWNSTWKIGVATSSSPTSGFVVQGYIQGLESMIDPSVFVDDDGQAYFYYGGGGVCKGGKLKANMMEIDGQLQTMQGLFDFHEATWVHKKNGVYYLSYSDNNGPGGNQMRYATSNSPLGPWTHRGVYIDPTGSPTNHGSIVEYKGQTYAFYHNSALSGHDWLRSVCIDKISYNADGTIQKVTQTKEHGTPFGGTARAIPGIIQAEDYDIGGPAVSYADNSVANEGGQYRNDRVDIGTCPEGGFNVGWVTGGEWLEYTVNVANTATYDLTLRVATEQSGTVKVEFGGVDKTGTLNVASTGSWGTYTNLTKSVSLTAGQQVMRVFISGGAFNLNYINITGGNIVAPVVTSAGTATGTVGAAFSYQITATNGPTSYSATGLPAGVSVNTSTGLISGTPTASGTFNATVSASNSAGSGSKALAITINPSVITHAIPGTVQAESYSAMFGIQTENTGDTGGGLNIGWIDANDWTEYSVNVSTAGSYTVNFRVASPNTGGQMQLRNSVGTVLATVAIPTTASWQTWTTVTATASLTAGAQTLRLFMVTGGFNVNYVEFVPTQAVPVISSAGTASGTTGQSFSYQITASNNPTSYGATGLPAGLSVNTSTGLISGIPTVSGTFNATVSATNSAGSGTKALTISIAQAAPAITSAGTATGTVGQGFSYQITATNNPTTYGATGLPPGTGINTTTGLISGNATTAGTFTMTVTATNTGGTGSKIVTVTISSSPGGSTPYLGTPWPIPGTIQAENYDDGGEGVAYHDNDVINSGGQQRTTQGVDVENTGDNIGGNYNVGWTGAGEWLNYSVNVTSTNTYVAQVRVASPNTGKSIRLEMDGTTIGTVAIPTTGGWQIYQTVNVNVGTITAGSHKLRVYMISDGFNLNYITFATQSLTPEITSAGTASGTVGSPFSYQITASNSPSSYGATGLPSGLSVNTSTGMISGTPSASGIFNATVTATNASGTGSKALTITVNPQNNATVYRIKNRWQNTYLYDAGDRVRYSSTASGTTFQWILEDVNGVKELKNVGTGEYMHIENQTGYVQCTSRTPGWSSSRWTTETVATGIVRFKNVWQPTNYIHIENLQNHAQHGTINSAWWSAQWVLEPVTSAKTSFVPVQDLSLVVSPNPVINGEINIETPDFDGEVTISISNDRGMNIYSGKEQVQNNELTLNVSQLKAGTYMIHLQQDSKVVTKKFIVQ